MNNLKTKIEVTCNLQGKAVPTTAKAVGVLKTRVIKDAGIEVGYEYKTENNEPILMSATTYTWEEVNALWEVIKGDVPLDSTFEELLDVAFLQAFKIEMASTFGITTAQIEEV
jgi:hypothetical protein